MSDTNILFIYIPCASGDEATKIGRALVEEKLAACANILPAGQAIYYWKGELNENSETVLILKTRATLYGKLEKRVLALHSYEVPCITALKVEKLNPAFAAWILEQTEAG